MAGKASEFTGDIPRNYNDGLGPVLFVPYADDLAKRVKAFKPASVLELAAGTGIVTRKLRDALPASTSIVASDLNQAMLDIASPQFKNDTNITFEVVDAMSIPKADDSFDLVTSQFGIMFMPDKVASLREARRVLRPGGTYLFNTWGSWDGNPWAGIGHKAIERFFPNDAPGFYKVPFHYHDPKEIKCDLKAAGFKNVKIKELKKKGRISSHEELAHAAVFGNPLADEIRALNTGVTPEQAQEAIRAALETAFGPAPTKMPLMALVVTATAP